MTCPQKLDPVVMLEFGSKTCLLGGGDGEKKISTRADYWVFEGAVDEREMCDDETLFNRLNWIRGTIAEAWSKNNARSSN